MLAHTALQLPALWIFFINRTILANLKVFPFVLLLMSVYLLSLETTTGSSKFSSRKVKRWNVLLFQKISIFEVEDCKKTPHACVRLSSTWKPHFFEFSFHFCAYQDVLFNFVISVSFLINFGFRWKVGAKSSTNLCIINTGRSYW